MKQEGIRAILPRKFKATTDSKHNFPVAPNLLRQDFDIKEPNKVTPKDAFTTCQHFEARSTVERETGSVKQTTARSAFDDLFKS